MKLHTVNKSPQNQALHSCLRIAAKGSAILLIEDGVYAAVAPSPLQEKMDDYSLYALEADVKARGLNDRVLEAVTLIDYTEFVTLVEKHDGVLSWF